MKRLFLAESTRVVASSCPLSLLRGERARVRGGVASSPHAFTLTRLRQGYGGQARTLSLEGRGDETATLRSVFRRTGRLLAAVVLLTTLSAAGSVAPAADLPPADARVEYLQSKRLRETTRLVWLLLSEGKVPEARRLLEGDVRRITASAAQGSLPTCRDAQLLYFAGIVEELAGNTARRDELFAAVRPDGIGDEFVHLELANIFEDLHREDIAGYEFTKVLETEPGDSPHDIEALERLAQCAATNRRWPRAAELYGKLLTMLRTSRRVQVREEALAYFEYTQLTSRGFALLEEKKPDAWQPALDVCERAWRLDPTRMEAAVLGEQVAAACTDAAQARELQAAWRGRSEQVLEVLRREITAEPLDPQNYNALAWYCALLGRNLDEGVRSASRALELRPDEPAFLDTLAELQFRKGDARAAAGTIRRVIDVCPFANDYYRHQLERFEAAK